MGTKDQQQRPMWLDTGSVAKGPGHPFFRQLDRLLKEHGFDQFVEGLCRPFYAARMGRPSLPPTVYFRLLLVGYFEGIDSERGIGWRLADSTTLREFLGYELSHKTPDHSTISRNRRLLPAEVHQEVFAWVVTLLGREGLLRGKSLGVDATTLEANAAMRSIVRRDSGERYQDYLTGLAKASGIATPTREDLARFDRKRKKKASNKDWLNPHDPDAKITKMKDGRTHLAHKAEHAVDLGEGLRRIHLWGRSNILKRLLIHVGAFNLGLVLRRSLGAGTPRGLRARSLAALRAFIDTLYAQFEVWRLVWAIEFPFKPSWVGSPVGAWSIERCPWRSLLPRAANG